ncbi:YjbF family lipoprotein [Rhodobacter capsulatus]|uniref:Group 4 capsule polysaccharide lipoprotein gfcB, YjbF n=1 Tax=Rhodobacter capsulatus TaxID=1061 RepID=A0A1G7J917_RHOCA|nr:YjbF family lipoprotein [Rhodobacter capsulatus]WER07772.1 YjbF family lipoprotein [Rhodobacter capsulatus]SDF21467.1 Group 4 capsule polysaccharide lipoprotein gfcB, YjbF [Rhodobacter capsulatus]
MNRRRVLTAFAVLAALAGCSSDPGTRALLTGALPLRARAADPNPEFAAAERAGAPALAAAVESRPEAIAVLRRQTVSEPDGVETMIAADGAQLMFQGGVLVGSRGFGADVMAAEVAQSAALVQRLSAGTSTRLMTLIDGNDHAVTRAFRCQITPGETETLRIGARAVPTRTVTEACRGPLARFYNFYWVVPETGEIVQSSQWTGPLTGKISLRRIDPARR